MEAYLGGHDLEKDLHVSVTFHAASHDIYLYWMGHAGDESSEVQIKYIPQGSSYTETTYPSHVFRTYNAKNKDHWVEHEIDANFGEHKEIRVEL